MQYTKWSDWLETPDGKDLFPSRASLSWFLRLHRQDMILAGVLIKFRNSWHLDAERFPQWISDYSRDRTRRIYIEEGRVL